MRLNIERGQPMLCWRTWPGLADDQPFPAERTWATVRDKKARRKFWCNPLAPSEQKPLYRYQKIVKCSAVRITPWAVRIVHPEAMVMNFQAKEFVVVFEDLCLSCDDLLGLCIEHRIVGPYSEANKIWPVNMQYFLMRAVSHLARSCRTGRRLTRELEAMDWSIVSGWDLELPYQAEAVSSHSAPVLPVWKHMDIA